MSSHIRITKRVAMYLISTARNLIQDGTGQYIDPDDDMMDGPGLMDRIPLEDADLQHWANALIQFARTVHGLVSAAMIDEVNIIPDEDQDSL
jgi:hypothetical protein